MNGTSSAPTCPPVGSITISIPSTDGTYNIIVTATDANGNTATSPAFTVTIDNPPVITVPPAPVTPTAGSVSVGVGDATSASYSINGISSGSITPTAGSISIPIPSTDGTYNIVVTATDASGNTATAPAFTVTVAEVNVAPVLAAIGPQSVNVGQQLTFTVSGSDPDGDTLAYSATGLQAGANLIPTTGVFTWTPGSSQAGIYPVTFTVTDTGGLSATKTISITVTDVTTDIRAPLILNFIATPNPSPINTPVTITAAIDDSTTGGSIIKSAHYSIDGSDWVAMNAVDGSWNTMIEKVTITLPAYTSAGIHTIRIQGTDAADNTAESSEIILLAVYDPSSGFVTGGGWINSPAGAYYADPAMTGKANFGFVAKYKKGANVPTGETEFQFKAGNLNFHSETYDWLVIAGPKAQFKGIGTINGQGSYGFMLTAVDGAVNGGGGQDKFRIKISDKTTGNLVYDNLLDAPDTADPTTVLGGGSIIIHK
jgi:hypothetical protein